MVRDLRDIYEQQASLRQALIEVYKNNYKSILKLAQAMNMPYTTVRAFLMGANIKTYNTMRIAKWLEQRIES